MSDHRSEVSGRVDCTVLSDCAVEAAAELRTLLAAWGRKWEAGLSVRTFCNVEITDRGSW